MQPTEKLYEADAFTRRFTAAVLACEPAPGGWHAALDRTAFYPEGGGQPCDTGTPGRRGRHRRARKRRRYLAHAGRAAARGWPC